MYFCRKINNNYDTLLQTYFVLMRLDADRSHVCTDYQVAGIVQGEEERHHIRHCQEVEYHY